MSPSSATVHHYTAPPTFRVALAERPRLREQLRAAGERRVILIDAPAGYGKTWLLGRWYSELRAAGQRVVWVGIDEADPAQFLAMVVSGLARAGLDLGPLEGFAEQGFADVPVRSAVTAITAALADADAAVTVFVDDLHRLTREAVHDVLARLIAEAPPSMRFACTGRDCSALARASLRARGELFEIDINALRFGADEARSFLPDLSPAQLAQLLARTEGWPVALQLARLWLEARPERSSLIDSFSGRTTEVAEYLAEQVLGELPPEVQQILEHCAILDSVNSELVATVTGHAGAWRTLVDEGRLEHFLVPLDEERYWFRLHHLLLDFLRARQRERGEDLRALHARAATWFELRAELLEAVRHHVQAEDVPSAVALVERSGGWQMVLFGGTVRMRALIKALPADRLGEFPRVQVFQAFVAAKEGDLARGLRLFESVRQAQAANPDPLLAHDLTVVGHLIGRYADLPVGSGDLAALYREFAALPPHADIAKATLLNTACLIALATGDMPAAHDACLRAVREMRRIGSVLGINYCLLHLGLTQLHLGERREAEATFRDAVTMAEESFGADSGLKAISEVHLALALHARGAVAESADRLSPSLPQLETADGWLDIYAEAYEVALAGALTRGDSAAALAVCERMSLTAERRGLVRLERLARAFRARVSPSSARDWKAGQWRETPSVWREHGAFGIALVIDALQASRPDDAHVVLDDLEAAARSGDRRRELLELAALRAAAHLQAGFQDAHIQEFLRTLDGAVREDATQYLIDLGPVLLPLLQRAWSWSRDNWSSSSSRHVLAAAATALTRADELSARELEVLVELARGAPNKVIARVLHMTENTVKYHLKNIFNKLKVRHRADALQVARARGLLH
ncbi:MAG TPA: LuxR C-terminal-related transcriptional regulator [Steroidobacteraceae bacterium]|nr:LuxR C-terminal-related transcriptional regulator [Steroidobacteraceae bacterium]